MTRFSIYGAMVLRVSLGAIYRAHLVALERLTFALTGTGELFGSVGLPGPLAYVAFAAKPQAEFSSS